MKRFITVLVGTVVVAAAGSASACPDTLEYTYVANSSVWTNIDDPIMAKDTPVGRVAANGWVRFNPTSEPKTLTVEDIGATAGGTVAVRVVQRFLATRTAKARVGASFFKCVTVGVPLTLTGFTEGGQMEVLVASDGWIGLDAPPCSAHAIGGQLTVQF